MILGRVTSLCSPLPNTLLTGQTEDSTIKRLMKTYLKLTRGIDEYRSSASTTQQPKIRQTRITAVLKSAC